jgi:hypothetical protein
MTPKDSLVFVRFPLFITEEDCLIARQVYWTEVLSCWDVTFDQIEKG